MDLSIIIPVFNSEAILENLVTRINLALNNQKYPSKFEILLVNDCSHDNSWEKIKFLCKKFENIEGINLTKNFGQHNAIMAGLNECAGDMVIMMDDDLQHPPESIKDIYNELNKSFDVCYAYYLKRQHPSWKRFVSWLNNIISSHLLNKPIKIYMSSFKGFKRIILEKIIKYQEPTVYLDGLILKTTRNVSMIYVPHHARFHGISNYNLKRLISLWFDMAVNFPLRPIRLAIFLGIPIKYLIIIYRKIFHKSDTKKEQYSIKEKTYK